MSNPLSILLVGDSDKDTGLLESILRKGGLDTKVNRISTKKDFGQALKEKNFDAIVCDLHIARSGGRSYFELFKNAGIDLPFFFISDSLDIDVAAELITAGAHDFIEKDRLFRLVPALIRELRAAQERKESQEKHARQEKQAKDALLGAIRQGPYGVGLFDSDDRLVSWNEQYRRHFEPEIELSEGKKFEDMLRASITHGKIDVPDGDIDKWVEWRLSKHRSPCGPIEMNFNGRAVLVDEHRTSDDGMILFVVDISAIKEAETTLQNREALLQAILDNSPSTIVVKDLDRRYSLVNEAYGERIGMSPDQFVGKKTEDIFPPEISEKIAELDRRVLEGERVSVTRELAHAD
ncbi:MAG: PAS domain-containing protein, partial [Rhodospirillales bacterium]|nr:PAS domain-containing protein [Rhodospirillales bacterium]